MANLRGVHPALRRWFAALHRWDARFVVTSGVRTYQQQQDLWNRYQRGDRTGIFKPMPPGKSSHERGLAIDVARFGKPAETDPALRIAGGVWKAHGGKWGGEKDPVHFGV